MLPNSQSLPAPHKPLWNNPTQRNHLSRFVHLGQSSLQVLGLVFGMGLGSGDRLFGQDPTNDGSAIAPPKPHPAVIAAQETRIRSMQKAAHATVAVHGSDGQGGGSGVCISKDGYVLTNFHVSSPFGHRMRCGMDDGNMYEAVVAGIDPTGDLAVLKMYGREDFPVADIGDSDAVRAGHWCFAGGDPFVLATNLQPTITYGLVSGVRRYQYPSGTFLEYSDCIQTDAAINPGNSGGPLFNMRGELIGINGRCSFEKRGRVNVGVGYAISVKQAMNFYWQLRSGRVVDHATLGFTVATDSKGKVNVSNILETSDAFRRGIRFGDEILRVGDREIATTNQLKNILGIYPDHWRIPIRFRNEEGIVDTFVRLQSLHLASELEEIVEGEASRPRKEETPKRGKPNGEEPKPNDKDAPKPSSPGEETEELDKAKQPKVVDVLADRFEPKRGFSNFHFNRQEMNRILKLQESHGYGKAPNTLWKWSGEIPNENQSISGEWASTGLTFRMDEKPETLPPTLGWQQTVKKESPMSLAMGLRIWQQWHAIGPSQMGESIYLGRNPVVGIESLLDTTKLTIGEVSCFVYTHPDDGRIAVIEIFADSTSDPAEIFFERYLDQDGTKLPSLLRLQFGLETRLLFQIKSHEFVEKTAEGGVQ